MKLPPMILHRLINVDPDEDAVVLSSPYRKLQVRMDTQFGRLGIYRDARSEHYQQVSIETEAGEKNKLYLIQVNIHLGCFMKWGKKLMLINFDNVETHPSNVHLNYGECVLWFNEVYHSFKDVSEPSEEIKYKWSDSLSAEEHFSG